MEERVVCYVVLILFIVATMGQQSSKKACQYFLGVSDKTDAVALMFNGMLGDL